MVRKRMAAAAACGALFLGVLTATPVASLVVTPTDPDRRCGWPIVYPGDANYAYPDTSAAYFVQAAILAPGDEIVVTGKDPKARYWSLQTYRFSDSTLLDSVNDVTVRRVGRGASATWTIRIVAPAADTSRDPNVLRGAAAFKPGDPFGSNITVVMYRVYASTTATTSGGALPQVTLKDAAKRTTERLTTCRPSQVGPPENRPVLEPAEGVGMNFVRGAAARFYPSADTAYLVAQAPYQAENILVMTGKAPRTPSEVRYWSVCQNINEGDLPVVDCVRDSEIKTNRAGRYAIAIVGEGQIPEEERRFYPGVTFLEWGDTSGVDVHDAFLLYRNILPNPRFRFAASKVPSAKRADRFIGEYAPRLTSVPIAQFRAEYEIE
jgi:hypothetical protein